MSMTRIAPLTVVLFAMSACQRLDVDSNDDGPAPTEGGDTTFSLPDPDASGEDEDDEEESEAGDSGGPMFDCDPILQTGCNGDEKCTVVLKAGEIGYSCVGDDTSLAPLESCEAALASGLDGCPAGTACLADESEQGLCAPLCLDSGDCAEGVCIPDLSNDIPYCAGACSPFEAMCPAPQQCRRLDDRFGCSFVRPEDTGAQGEPCTPAGDVGCAEGFACLPGGLVPMCASDSCCTVLCDTTLGGCDSPATCTSVFDAPAPGAESIGVCIVPS